MNSSASLWVVLGAGGVGKTSTAASLGLAAAKEGRKVVVITVDPARRLAQVLGLESFQSEPTLVCENSETQGSLHALWLDTDQFLRDLVLRYASNKEIAEKILKNRMFNIIKDQLGGIEEYLGVEKIVSLAESGRFDLCILDTPPSRHALDFLESPRHLIRFFDEGVLKIFLSDEKKDPEENSSGFWSQFKKKIMPFKAVEIFRNFLGSKFLNELSELLGQLRPVYEVFSQTARKVEAWVLMDGTRFILVGVPEKIPAEELHLLALELESRNLKRPSLIILNKSLPQEAPDSWKSLETVAGFTIVESLKNNFLTQNLVRQKIKDNQILNKITLVECERFPVSKLSLVHLKHIGDKVFNVWRKADPTLFLKK